MVPGIARDCSPRAFRSRLLHRRRRHRPNCGSPTCLRTRRESTCTSTVRRRSATWGTRRSPTTCRCRPVATSSRCVRAARPRARRLCGRARPPSRAGSSTPPPDSVRARQLEAHLFTDDVTTPAPGTANVRFLHAAVGTAAVNVTFAGSSLTFPNASFRHAHRLPSGRGRQVRRHVDGRIGERPRRFAVDRVQPRHQLHRRRDRRRRHSASSPSGGGRAGVVVSPVGALSTGAGGTAPRPQPGPGPAPSVHRRRRADHRGRSRSSARAAGCASTPREGRPARRDAGRSTPRREHGLGLGP